MRGTLVLAAVALAVLLPMPASAAAGCTALQARAGATASTVYRVTLPGGETRLGTVPYRLDALGYSREQDLVYGVATGARTRAVALDRAGTATDLGPLRGVPAGTEAGAVSGTSWYLRAGARLYTVDVDPASRRYLRVVGTRQLSPRRLAGVADFAAGADGMLRGVTVSGKGDVIAVGINPNTGAVVPRPRLQLPASRSFASVVADGDGTLYAATREPGGRGGWYRATAGAVDQVATAPGSARTDAAGCLTRAAPPAPGRPPPPDRPSPPPAAEPESPAAPDRPGEPAPPRMPPPEKSAMAQEEQEAEQVRQDAITTKRRWSVTTLLLILGAAAVHRGR